MDRRLALGMLGLEPSATPEDIERAYWEKCAELEDRIRIAPTAALKKVYREALESVEEARAAALELQEGAAAAVAEAEESPPAELTSPSAAPAVGEEPESDREVVPPPEPDQAVETAGTERQILAERQAPPTEEAPLRKPPEEPSQAHEPERAKPVVAEQPHTRAEKRVTRPHRKAAVPSQKIEAVEEAEGGVALSAAETAVGFFEGQLLMDRYDILYRIGMGRSGATYAASDRVGQKSVAVKILLPGCVADPAGRQRLAAEVKVASYLSHPNIGQVYDLLQHGTTDFITMELLKGRTLREEMDAHRRAQRPFTIREVSRVGAALCAALQYAHKYTVHRSIRPDNIFLCDDGKVKLTDFAMAALPPAGGRASGTGPDAYLAPEQRGEGTSADPRTDQYALAAVLYEMLTGATPGTPMRPVGTLRADVPPDMSAAIGRALQPKPDDRFADMQVFGNSLVVPLVSASLPPTTWVAGGGVLLVLVALVVYLVWRPAPPTQVPPTPQEAAATPAAVLAAGEAARIATARAQAEEERLAAERARAEADRAATMAQAEAERVATIRSQAEAEQVAAAERAREEAARLTATRAADALSRAEAEARAAEERRLATRKEAEANRTATAVARAEERKEATARAQAEADARATARAETEQARVATVEAREAARREATERALAERAERTARAGAQESARAVATARQAEVAARKNYVPDLNAKVTSLRFFEKARGEQVPEGKREYANRFKASKTRAIYWELSLEHPPLGQRKNLVIRSVCYGPDGTVFGEGDLNTYVEANWGKSKHIYGWGFDEAGHWKDGKYRVELFIGDKKITSGSFELYSGFF
jgi:hypothetical protein